MHTPMVSLEGSGPVGGGSGRGQIWVGSSCQAGAEPKPAECYLQTRPALRFPLRRSPADLAGFFLPSIAAPSGVRYWGCENKTGTAIYSTP